MTTEPAINWSPKTPGTYRVELTFLNATCNHGIGESTEQIEAGSISELKRKLRTEYGTTFEPMFQDRRSGPPVQTGFVIRGRDRYSDTNETYIRETWVTVGIEEECQETGEERYTVGVKPTDVIHQYPVLRRSA